MDRDKVIDRIRKLYSMSQAADSSPNEAEIALRRCQSLMQKFGITIDDLSTSEFGASSIGKRFRSVPSYITVLSSAVALLHDCLCVESQEIEFRGFQIDAEVAKLTFDYLFNSMERSLRLHKRNGTVSSGRRASFDYRVGFALAVLKRCRALHAERIATSSASVSSINSAHSLVVQKKQLVEENCCGDIAGERKRTIRMRTGDAHYTGAKDGLNVSLDKQIETKKSGQKPVRLVDDELS